MPAAKSLRTTSRAHTVAQFTGGAPRGLVGNMGTSDIRGTSRVQTITMQAWAASDEFRIRVYRGRGEQDYAETAAIVHSTNSTKAAIQALLRALQFPNGDYWDTGVVVGGTDDTGPFTLTSSSGFIAEPVRLTHFVTASAKVGRGAPSYIDATGHAADANQTPSSPGDAAGFSAPLGTSETVDVGSGQTEGVTLAPPTWVSAVGGDDQVVIDGTEVASGGTSATVLYAVFDTDSNAFVKAVTDDADGDVTITGLPSATDLYVVGYTQSTATVGSNTYNRVSKPSEPAYFTTT